MSREWVAVTVESIALWVLSLILGCMAVDLFMNDEEAITPYLVGLLVVWTVLVVGNTHAILSRTRGTRK